jgi:hypothetical protein
MSEILVARLRDIEGVDSIHFDTEEGVYQIVTRDFSEGFRARVRVRADLPPEALRFVEFSARPCLYRRVPMQVVDLLASHEGQSLQSQAEEIFGDIPSCVGIRANAAAREVLVVFRVPFDRGGVPSGLGEQLVERKMHLPKGVQLIAAPEDNYPPYGVDPHRDPVDGVKAKVMEAMIDFLAVKAVYAREDEGAVVEIIARLDQAFDAELEGVVRDLLSAATPPETLIDVIFQDASSPMLYKRIPKTAQCILNNVTRSLFRMASQDGKEPIQRSEADREAERLRRFGPPETRFVGCRWCNHPVPDVSNPAASECCPVCNAIQGPVTIQTRMKSVPRMDLYLNPDQSLYFEIVYAPPEGKTFAHSKVVRYRVPAPEAVFDQHPFGRRNPKK